MTVKSNGDHAMRGLIWGIAFITLAAVQAIPDATAEAPAILQWSATGEGNIAANTTFNGKWEPFWEHTTELPHKVIVDGGNFIGSVGMHGPVMAPFGSDGTLYLRHSTLKQSSIIFQKPCTGPNWQGWLRSVVHENHSMADRQLTKVVLKAKPNFSNRIPLWVNRNFVMGGHESGVVLAHAVLPGKDAYSLRFENGEVTLSIDACWRLNPMDKAEAGSLALWVAPGPEEDSPAAWRRVFRREAARWHAHAGNTAATDAPDWLGGMVLYECNAGGHIDSRFSDVGGFARLAGQMPMLADLGVNAVWLQSIHTHKIPPNPMEGGWNLYDPLDFSAIDPILGGEAGLHALCGAFKANGIRFLGEIVPHGGHSKQGLALERWWTRDQNGEPLRTWGGYAMDLSSPEWQRVMGDTLKQLAAEYGMAGARVDVADGSGPNWHNLPHASASTLGGSVAMLGAMKSAMAEAGVQPVLIPESFDQAEYFPITPVGYGHDTWMMFARELPGQVHNASMMAETLARFFNDDYGSHPPGARILRTLNNHDTVCERGRTMLRYGAGLSRALFGVCLMVDGLPMLYQEEEIGSFFALRDMIVARRQLPEFQSGAADYECVEYHPDVFGCLRVLDGTKYAVGLSNLSGREVSGTVTVAETFPLPENAEAVDFVSGRRAPVAGNRFTWTMKPYGTALIRVTGTGEGPERTAPAVAPVWREDADGEEPGTMRPPAWRLDAGRVVMVCGDVLAEWVAPSGAWVEAPGVGGMARFTAGETVLELEDTGGHVEIRVSGPMPTLRILNSRAWAVSGRTALLQDLSLRRHFPWPDTVDYRWDPAMAWMGYKAYTIAPTGRYWESVWEPLHPESSGLGFSGAAGDRLVLDHVRFDGVNMVLQEDLSAPEEQGCVFTLSFHGEDPALIKEINTFGPGQPWRAGEGAAIPAKSDNVLTVRCGHAAGGVTLEEKALVEAPRLPVLRGARKVMTGRGSFENNLGIWLPGPGTVSWSGLSPVPGTWRLRFELRQSEQSAEGDDLEGAYRITVNGRKMPLDWTKKGVLNTGNAWFGHAETGLVALGGDPAEILIETARSWCAIRPEIVLLPAE